MPDNRAQRFQALIWLGFAGACVWLLAQLSPILAPFLLAAILAYIGNPGAEWLTRHRVPRSAAALLVILAVLSISFVFSLNPLSAASGWIAQAVERPETVVPASLAAPSAGAFEEALHHAHGTAMLLSICVAGLGILTAFLTFAWKRISADAVARSLRPVHTFLLNKWYFDEVYMGVVVRGVLGLTQAFRWVDVYIIDGIVNGAGVLARGLARVSGGFDTYVVDGLVNLTARVSGALGLVFRKSQTGRVQTYVALALFSVMVFYFVFRLV